jgi:hypothetical protein
MIIISLRADEEIYMNKKQFDAVITKMASDCRKLGLHSKAEMFDNMLIKESAKYQGKEVKLNDPIRSKNGPKKFHVYVKDPKTGNVKKVNFGDPNMDIKRDDPKRKKSFRARHKCDQAKDKTKAKYWSCKMWSSKKVSKLD